jgi:hypothetical protein
MTSIEERLRRIEGQIQQLFDVEAVRKNLAAYCKAVDTKNIDLLGSLFSRDMDLSVSPWSFEFHGRDAIIDFYIKAFLDTDGSRHNCVNEVIQASEGGGYTSSCYFHSTIAIGSESLIGWGNYDDTFILEDGVLKFKKKVITVMVLAPLKAGWAGPDKIVSVH